MCKKFISKGTTKDFDLTSASLLCHVFLSFLPWFHWCIKYFLSARFFMQIFITQERKKNIQLNGYNSVCLATCCEFSLVLLKRERWNVGRKELHNHPWRGHAIWNRSASMWCYILFLSENYFVIFQPLKV